MSPPPTAAGSHQMYCRSCGYALIGLPSNRCPECGRDFDPGNPKSFLAHPRGMIRRRVGKIFLGLFCLALAADAYYHHLAGQLQWEKAAIQFLRSHGAAVSTYDTTPSWARVVFHGHAAWLWERADAVKVYGAFVSFNKLPERMAAVGNLKSLRSLEFFGVPVTDSDLAYFKNLTSLQLLGLNRAHLTDAGLVNLKGLTALQKLYLDKTSVTDAGLANLKGLAEIQELCLNSTSVTGAGFANLKDLTALQRLDLQQTSVTDEGLENLKGLMALQSLDLRYTIVTNAGLPYLKSLIGLQRLDLIGTQVTDAGVRALSNQS